MKINNKVQLITYPDSLGGNLKNLCMVLSEYLPNLFPGGVHILPPFTSSGDRGFATINHMDIDPEFGTWEDIRRIAGKFDVMLDLMANHVSKQSEFFQDFLLYGCSSKYADMFITMDKIWPDGNPPREEIEKIFLRREEPFSEYKIEETGEIETVWTTFGKTTPSEQIDIDVHTSVAKKYIEDVLVHFSKNNIKLVRIDAIGYAIKKPGTSCFFVEPEIYDLLYWIRNIAHSLEMEILPEVHAHRSITHSLAEKGYWIYDFILPYLVLSTLINKNSIKLREYLASRPHNQFTMLDCHDGVPIAPDLNDLVTSLETRKVVDICVKRGANLSPIFSLKHRTDDGYNVHQIRGTYYSMLNCDNDAYLAARAIQFFTPGIPQVYYVGLLAGKNDFTRIKETGDGREINRHNFTLEEIKESLQKEVVQRLLKLIRFRNEHEAFNGDFQVLDSNDDNLLLVWEKGNNYCRLNVDLNTHKSMIIYNDENGSELKSKV